MTVLFGVLWNLFSKEFITFWIGFIWSMCFSVFRRFWYILVVMSAKYVLKMTKLFLLTARRFIWQFEVLCSECNGTSVHFLLSYFCILAPTKILVPNNDNEKFCSLYHLICQILYMEAFQKTIGATLLDVLLKYYETAPNMTPNFKKIHKKSYPPNTGQGFSLSEKFHFIILFHRIIAHYL